MATKSCLHDAFVVVLNTIFQEWAKNADSSHTLKIISDVFFFCFLLWWLLGTLIVRTPGALLKAHQKAKQNYQKETKQKKNKEAKGVWEHWELAAVPGKAVCINEIGTHDFMGVFYCFNMCIWLPRRPLVSCPLKVGNHNSYNHQCNRTCKQWPWMSWTCFLA